MGERVSVRYPPHNPRPNTHYRGRRSRPRFSREAKKKTPPYGGEFSSLKRNGWALS